MTTNQRNEMKKEIGRLGNSEIRGCWKTSTSISESKGQATMEYFILFTVLAVLTIIGGSTFFSQVSNTMDNFTESAVNIMGQPNIDSFE